MSNTIQKRCRDCGTDVANQKRTKDAAGNYYCQPCYATRTKSPESPKDSPVCSSCGAAIIGDAAFCGRCGAKRDGHMSVDESIDMTSLVGYLGKYGEHSEALSMVPDLTKQMLDAIEIAKSRRDQAMLVKMGEHARIAEAQTEATTKDCEEIRSRLAAFDQVQLRKVRDLILANESVSSGVKTGLRYDALGLFGQPKVEASPTAPEVGTRSPHVSRAPSSREANLRNGIISVGIFIAAVLVGIVTNNMIANSVSIENENTIRSWATPVIALAGFAGFLSAIFAIVYLTSYASSSPDQGNDSPFAAKTPQSGQANATSGGLSQEQKLLWGCCVIGCLISAFTIYWGGSNVYHGFMIGPDAGKRQLIAGGIQIVVGLVILGRCIAPMLAACPSCHVLNAARIIDATLLDRRMESEAVEHNDKHYDADNRYVGTTTRESHRLVTVDTVLKQYECKHCGHRWEEVVKSKD